MLRVALLCLSPLAPLQDTLPDGARDVRPLLEQYCFGCHGPDRQKGDLRLDILDPDLVAGPDGDAWVLALDMIGAGDMPPRRADQPTDDERRALVAWMRAGLERRAEAHGTGHAVVLRRLTKAQYTNTLQDLLGVRVDFGRPLPDDGKSRLGFSNDGAVLEASALHVDYYQAIARRALDAALSIGPRPATTRYRVTFGKGIGRGHVAAETGGYQAVPVSQDDLLVEVLDEQGRPRIPADDAERAQLDEVRRHVSAGLRGSSMDRFGMAEDGMLLYSALPHVERPPASWQGPSPNLKLELQRCFPERGDFELRVHASRGRLLPTREPRLLALEDLAPRVTVEPDSGALQASARAVVRSAAEGTALQNVVWSPCGALVAAALPEAAGVSFDLALDAKGFYQVDLVHPPAPDAAMPSVRLEIDALKLDQRPHFTEAQLAEPLVVTPLGAATLERGTHRITVGGRFFVGLAHLVLTPLSEDEPAVARLTARTEESSAALRPSLRAYLGTRTDDGMDYACFGASQVVDAPLGAPRTYTFRGRLEDLPIPEPESGDTEILSGFLVAGIWNDHLVKRRSESGPPLLVRWMELEAPLHETWPTASHRAVFFESPLATTDAEAYTREVLARFLARAFRRPVRDDELERYVDFWRAVRDDYTVYEEGVREVLVAALCSPSFLFLPEPEQGPSQGGLPDEALATRLAYFLWDSPPDEPLLELARRGALRDDLDAQVDRLLDDPRAWRFVRAFGREWLRLDRHDTMTVDPDLYPDLTRFVKEDMAEETLAFLHEVLARDLSVLTFVDSDFAMLNQNLAEFYGVPGVVGNELRAVPVDPALQRGGLLSQGSFLAGHSDGREAHPIKRAVWLKSKLLASPPPPPPPNVPRLDPEAPGFAELTLKEQLERHRDNPSCMDCHASIDPWGIPFEQFDASGRLVSERKGRPVDAESRLSDGTVVDGVAGLKGYLLEHEADRVLASVVEHLYAYALGRDVTFADDEDLARICERVRSEGYRLRSVLRAIVASPSFSQREP